MGLLLRSRHGFHPDYYEVAAMTLRLLPCFLATTMTLASTAHAADPVPGASRLLVVTPQAFRSTCTADIAQARQAAGRFKTSSGGAAAVPDEYDSAIALLADAAARASLARSVHPDQAMRDAASACEADVDKANTELTLDRAIYDRMTAL